LDLSQRGYFVQPASARGATIGDATLLISTRSRSLQGPVHLAG
jgi:hypothetical protein